MGATTEDRLGPEEFAIEDAAAKKVAPLMWVFGLMGLIAVGWCLMH